MSRQRSQIRIGLGKMRKRKMRKESGDEKKRIQHQEEEVDGKRFFGCYLLTSLCPRFKGHTYIGYTVNPRRRIRQHNGEIGCGAWRTKKKRPWEMVLCIYGFPTNVAALQFEWAWQHPMESLAVRSAAATFKSISGIANKVKLAYTMLTLPAWESLNLTVNFFSTKYQSNASGCPPLPKQMRTRICSMDDLACYNEDYVSNDEGKGDEDSDININSQEQIDQVSAEATEMLHIRDSSDEKLTKYNPSWPMNSSPIRERDKDRSLNINESPARTFSSFASTYIVEDVGTSKSEEQLGTEFEEDQVLTTNGGVIGRQIEIIDIFTPSACYKSGRKKRRPAATALCSEIIDLTNSPVLV